MDRRSLLGLARWPLLSGCSAPALAMALDPPSGPVLLTLSGNLRHTNRPSAAAFDMAMLERLPQQQFSTTTPWYRQPRQFTGPLLRDVLASAGAQGQLLRAQALNNYYVDIPSEDTRRYDVLLARLLDGKPMAVRDKGPLFIIYPFHAHPELRNAVYYSRCAWQLQSIEVS